MDEFERDITQLGRTCCDSNQFIQRFEKKYWKTGFFAKNKPDRLLLIRAGIILLDQAQFNLAIDCWNHTLSFVIKENNKWAESACYTNIARAYANMKNFVECIEFHKKAVLLDEILPDKGGLAEGYAFISLAFFELKNYDECIKYGEKAIMLLNECGKARLEQHIGCTIGQAYHILGEQSFAIEYLKIAIEDFKDLEEAGISPFLPKADVLGLLGKCYYDSGDFQNAIDTLESAVAASVSRRIPKTTEYTNLAAAYSDVGNFGRAILNCEKALRLAIDSSNIESQSTCYLNLGYYHDSLNEHDKAIEYYQQALPLKRIIKDKSGESRCLTNLGEAHRCRGYKETNSSRKEQANEDFRNSIMNNLLAFQIAKEINNYELIAKSSGNLANTYACMGKTHSSIEWNLRALELAKSMGEKQTILSCYSNLSDAYESLDEQKSAEYADLALSVKSNDVYLNAILYVRLAKRYFESDPLRSYNYCLQSLEASKQISTNLFEESLKINYNADLSKIYDILIPLCVKLNKKEEAFEYCEESKSRSQHELLSATELTPKIEITEEIKQLLLNEEKCLERLRQIQMRYLEPTAVEVEPDETEQISNKLSLIYKELENIVPDYVSLRKANPLKVGGIKKLLTSLGDNVILIEYYLTDAQLFVFAISTLDYELHIEPVNVSSDELFKYILLLDEEVFRYKDTGKTSESWLELSKYILKPIAKFIPPSSTIYFVPDRVLNYIPLHALELDGTYLIMNHPIAYSSSASILNLCLNKGTDKHQTCAAFGIKPFDNEAVKIAEFLNAKAFTDNEAIKAEVKRNQNKDIIHLSCHGEFNLEHPHKSGIIMFDDSLTVKDILKMHMKTELVTLSACSTGLSKFTDGNEMVGLTRAVLYAGAPSVIVSLWPVYGPSTEDLMIEFYSQFTGKNSENKCYNKAISLQRAQIKLMEKYPHPFYWAPFLLIGKL